MNEHRELSATNANGSGEREGERLRRWRGRTAPPKGRRGAPPLRQTSSKREFGEEKSIPEKYSPTYLTPSASGCFRGAGEPPWDGSLFETGAQRGIPSPSFPSSSRALSRALHVLFLVIFGV